MARLFVSQSQMDQWTAAGKVALQDDVMAVPALGRTFRLEGAVRVLKVVGGSDDQRLIGKVKTSIDLAALGAEHYGTSVLVGETAYECEEGFVGTVTDPGKSGGASGLLALGK